MMATLLIFPIHKACASNCFPNHVGESALYVMRSRNRLRRASAGIKNEKCSAKVGPKHLNVAGFPKVSDVFSPHTGIPHFIVLHFIGPH